MNRALAAAALLTLASTLACAQSQSSSSDSDVDNLFNGSQSTPPAPSAPQQPGQSAPQQPGQSAPQQPAQTTPQPPAQPPAPDQPSPSLRPDDILQDRKLHFFGSLDLYGEAGGGWAQMPDFTRLGSNLGHDIGGSMGASLGFEIRPASELRIRAKLSYSFPGSGESTLPLLSEMFFDYSLLDRVFFRIGIFDYTWGNSQFFLFGNLPARSLPGWTGAANLPFWERTNLLTTVITQNYPVSFKMSVPMGFNTLTFLARFDLANYGFSDPTAPNPRNAGYGLEYDLVTGPIEWSLAGFYQWLLTPRSMLSMKTSLFGFDLSMEATMAFPVMFSATGLAPIPTTGGGIYVGGDMQRIYPTAVIGIAREWYDPHIRLYAEYGYNGEREPGTNWLQDETGPGGHNTALGVRYSNVGQSGVTLNLLWQHNWSDGSGMVAPFVEFSPVGLTTIQVGLPVVYGPDNSEVSRNRLAPGGQRLELLILIKVSSSFQQ